MTLPLPAWTLLTNAFLGYATVNGLLYMERRQFTELPLQDKIRFLVNGITFGSALSCIISLITPLYDRVFFFLPPILREGVTVVTHLAAGCLTPFVAEAANQFLNTLA